MNDYDVGILADITTIGLIIAAICTTMFPLLYATRSPWTKSKLGWILLVMTASLAMTNITRVWFRLDGDTSKLKFALWTAETLFMTVSSVAMTVYLFVIQQKGRKGSTHDRIENESPPVE